MPGPYTGRRGVWSEARVARRCHLGRQRPESRTSEGPPPSLRQRQDSPSQQPADAPPTSASLRERETRENAHMGAQLPSPAR